MFTYSAYNIIAENGKFLLSYFYFSVLSLQELCSRAIVASTTVYGIEHLPLPPPIKSHLKSYTSNHATRLRQVSLLVLYMLSTVLQ